MQTESELFDKWRRRHFYNLQESTAFAAWRELIRMMQTGELIPDREYHPNQTLEDGS